MRFTKTFIPYGGYWSTPFVRWQGSYAHLHALIFAADVARQALAERGIDPGTFDELHLGMTVPQQHSFYGAPWVAGLIGAESITGPTISQACATSARVVASAAMTAEVDDSRTILALTADKTSNGPHVLYPNPLGPGGKGEAEDWVWDNFNCDPFANNAMIETAENVARQSEITREEQDEVSLLRYEQYQDALKEESAFLKRFMILPLEVKLSRRKTITVEGDEGIFPTTAEGLAGLRPVLPDGTVTYGGQTYPADGNCGLIVTSKEQAKALSRQPEIEIQVVSAGQGRAPKGYMAQATVPAARQALDAAGLAIEDIRVIKTHNPFAVNDVYFSQQMGVALEAMNNYGSSLVWGHPQGPTGMRLIIEAIEELVLLGGGYGLFTGCAAGDTAGAVIVKVSEAEG